MIKKIFFMFTLLFLGNVVYAEKFTIGDYITGEYIKMVGDDTSKYLTIQRINDSNGNFVYCIEPFVLVDETNNQYTTYVKDLTGYKDLTEEQKRKISLIAYYGYGYSDRVTQKWYAITQMLIWRTVDPDSEFYFTDTINGNKIDKYTGSMNQILSDVYEHDNGPIFIKDYSVNYKDNLVITNYDNSYSIDTTYDYVYDSSTMSILVDMVQDSGTFTFERKNDYYLWDTVIFDSENSQDLIRPGKVINKLYTINVSVNSGEMILDIVKDNNGLYSIESDFSNTCYEISKGDIVVDKVCTSNEELSYKTGRLPYGEYTIRQVSVGKGYEVDTNIYSVIIDSNDTSVVLSNSLIKNKIELVKYYCINDNCLYEENAIFNVYDKDNNLVGSITTDSSGYGFVEVGYGKYTVIQEDGLDNYTFVDEYTEDVINSKDKHYKELYNYYIEEIVGDYGTLEPNDSLLDNNNQNILEPPYTGTKLAEFMKILYNVIMILICYCNLKRFCYNN